MQSLMAKVEYINNECQDPEKKRKKEEEMKNWDDFTKLRKKVAQDLRHIREQIQERNALMGKTDMGNTTTVKMGRDIRNGLKDIIKEADELESMQKREVEKLEKKKLKNKPVDPKEEEEAKNREEIVLLCRQHIEECKRLEKQVRGVTGVFTDNNTNEPLITSLPDIDGDEGFQLLRRQDQQIDEELERASKGVAVLKDIAIEMGKEVEMQEMMIDELGKKVEKTNAKLINLNKRLKKTLQDVRKADRFCIDIILLVVILAIGGYLYNAFTHGGF